MRLLEDLKEKKLLTLKAIATGENDGEVYEKDLIMTDLIDMNIVILELEYRCSMGITKEIESLSEMRALAHSVSKKAGIVLIKTATAISIKEYNERMTYINY